MNDTERSHSNPTEDFDWEEFRREIDAARFRAEQQQPPEDSVSQDEIYVAICAFMLILMVVIVLALWFTMASEEVLLWGH